MSDERHVFEPALRLLLFLVLIVLHRLKVLLSERNLFLSKCEKEVFGFLDVVRVAYFVEYGTCHFQPVLLQPVGENLLALLLNLPAVSL